MYRPLQDLLPHESNITNFANRFTIIAENSNQKQALDRIYKTSDLEAIKTMRKTTTLEKKAYKNLGKLGVAAGVIPAV